MQLAKAVEVLFESKSVCLTPENMPSISSEMFLHYVVKNKYGYDTILQLEKKFSSKVKLMANYAKEVNFVEIKRNGNICIVEATIHPKCNEYCLSTVKINEKTNIIIAAEGNCYENSTDRKTGQCIHVAILIKWLNFQTEIRLSRKLSTKNIGRVINPFFKINKPSKCSSKKLDSENSVFNEDKKLFKESIICSIYFMKDLYDGDKKNAVEFLEFASEKLTVEICDKIQEYTRYCQIDRYWTKLRYGRFLASDIYYSSLSLMVDNHKDLYRRVLFNQNNVNENLLMREKTLKDKILATIESRINRRIEKCGIVLNGSYPVFIASPDGIGDDFVVEVKCPTNATNIINYCRGRKILEPYKTEIHLQMLLCGKSYGYYCVAHPHYESNDLIIIIREEFDENFIMSTIEKSIVFWKYIIFPKIMNDVHNYR
ncbi:uncharacterized protein LOC103575558 isoform X2 [Microplitis demolitor]|uniref:uncharacterized protein LOC103575558 isoform X2 n=1 Tax=Microplitis demolitor TaxID=69319 RepID=UPI00235B6DAC|nr:uncharacterized protein LOC103575558 isoform X2 [Microplitis demolitor]